MLPLRYSVIRFGSLALISLAFILSTTEAFPYNKSARLSIQAFSSQAHQTPRKVSTARVRGLLEVRTPPYELSRFNQPIFGMQKVLFTVLGSLTPVPAAVRRMENLYIDVVQAALGEWSRTPRMPGFYYSDDVFALAMQCQGGVIPWEFVAEIADMLWESTVRGSTLLFSMLYSSPDRDVMVQISLTLMQAAVGSGGPGTGTSSGDTNWREGSVPSVAS
ncbi:MAG: hypothetical protein Q9186_001808 [Xanthomendoza sp. 1 TL-2023]